MKSSLSLFLLLVSSCSFFTDNLWGNFPNSNDFLTRFPENKKSLIIIKNQLENIFWCKVENEKDQIKQDNDCIEVRTNELNQVIMLDPGIYKLVDYSFTKENYIFGKKSKNLSSKFSLFINISADEIAYIGFVERSGNKYGMISEFLNLQKAFKSRNYQQIKSSFYISLPEIEFLTKKFDENPSILKEKLAEIPQFEEKKPNNFKKNSCPTVCNYDFIEKRQQDLKLNKEKYNDNYIRKLQREISLEKEKCGNKNEEII